VVQNETGVATAVIKPGYLVDGVTSIAPHASAAAAVARQIALERDELGTGIDATYTTDNSGVGSPNYAIGDVVKVGVCPPGVQFTGWISSGQNIAANDQMESAGNGTFRKLNSGVILARALEAYDARNVVGPVTIRLEVM
jgi:hypothetical protein